MKVVSLNGFSRLNVDATEDGRMQRLNGFSRINPTRPMQGFTLNGFTFNGFELNALAELDDTEFEILLDAIDDGETVNGIFKRLVKRRRKKRAEGKTTKARRRHRKDARLSSREERKRLKRDKLKARTERIRSRKDKPNFLESIKGVAEKFIGGEGAPEFLSDIADDIGIDMDAFLPEDDEGLQYVDTGADKRGLFKPKPFYKKPFKKWSTMQKVGVIGGGVVAIDLITGGKVREMVGMKKKTSKKRR